MSEEKATAGLTKLCPDCHGVLYEIKLNIHASGLIADQPTYSLPEARRSFWTGKPAAKGLVEAFLCDECGRILLYAQPKTRD